MMRMLFGSLLIPIVLGGCDSLSTSNLAGRCERLYDELNNELTQAIIAHDQGEAANEVLARFSPRIRHLADDLSSLRRNLAEGGQRHRWPWPSLVIGESILRYETTLGNYAVGLTPADLNRTFEEIQEATAGQRFLPNELAELGEVERTTFEDAKWFCNRVVAANSPPVESAEDAGLFLTFMGREMAARQLDILEATQTEEELEAFLAYLRSVGALRVSPPQ